MLSSRHRVVKGSTYCRYTDSVAQQMDIVHTNQANQQKRSSRQKGSCCAHDIPVVPQQHAA
eukprot:352965-Chlamydomonas_euryale.AAC.18